MTLCVNQLEFLKEGDTHMAVSSDIGISATRKVSKKIIPFLVLLYFIAFLDRVNTGYAALQMNSALSISASAFGLISGIFFVGYFLFEVPSNLMLNKIGARIWIMRILVTWGIIAGLTASVQNVTDLYVARFLLGAAEAGFFPGIILYLTFWFRERDQARAVALFMTALAFSGLIGGPVSGLILAHMHVAGIAPWRWLYIIEGIPAVALGIYTLKVLPDRPKDAAWLTAEEKEWLETTLAAERAQKTGRNKMSVGQTLRNGRIWLLTLVYLCLVTGLYGIGFWLPQVVKSLSTSYSVTTVGFLSAIPFIFGGIAMVVVGRHSDKTGERRWHTALPQMIAAVALIGLGATKDPWISIALLSLATAGIYSFFGPFWAIPSQFLTEAAAAAGIAFINSVGNLGGFVGPYVIGVVKGATGSAVGGLVSLAGFLVLGGILALMLKTKASQSVNAPSDESIVDF